MHWYCQKYFVFIVLPHTLEFIQQDMNILVNNKARLISKCYHDLAMTLTYTNYNTYMFLIIYQSCSWLRHSKSCPWFYFYDLENFKVRGLQTTIDAIYLLLRPLCFNLTDDDRQSSQDFYAKPQCRGQTVQQQDHSSVQGQPSAEEHHGAGRITVTLLILLHIIISTMTGTVRSAMYHRHCTTAGAPPSLLVWLTYCW